MRFLIQYIIYSYKYFKLKIRKSFKKRYCFLIFDEYTIYIKIKTIKFYINNNILYFSFYILYIF